MAPICVSTIFVYSGACITKSLHGICICMIQAHSRSYGGSRIDDSHCCRNVEIKYFCTKNVVIHTENCKLNLPLDCSTTQMEKNIRRMCDIDKSSRRRGLTSRMADFLQAGMAGM